MRVFWLTLTVFATAGLSGCATDSGQCVIHPVADLHTLEPQGLPLVSVTVGSRPAVFAIDTGASDSLLVGRFAEEAGLQDRSSAILITGANGAASNRVVTVPSLTVGYATAQDVRFFVYGRPLPVARSDGTPVDGLFGGDFLANYDLELDLSAQKVGIFQSEHCGGSGFRPLGPIEFVVPIALSHNHVFVTASVDGHEMPFVLDSGASQTSLTSESARALGLTSDSMAADPALNVRGTGSRRVVARLHHFQDFVLGNDHVHNPVIAVHDGSMNILGDDFLRRNRIWLSYGNHRLHVRPISLGPVADATIGKSREPE